MWNPPYIKGAMRGENDAPLHNDPVENLKSFGINLLITNIVANHS